MLTLSSKVNDDPAQAEQAAALIDAWGAGRAPERFFRDPTPFCMGDSDVVIRLEGLGIIGRRRLPERLIRNA